MSDIVERLRTGKSGYTTWTVTPTHREAADEIERLRAAVAAARREGIEAAAHEVDCGCDIRDAVLVTLEIKGRKRAADICPHVGLCCALQASKIRTLKWEGRHD